MIATLANRKRVASFRLIPKLFAYLIAGFLNAEYRHVGYLLPLVLKSVRFGGFVPLYHCPASHEGKDMGDFVCAAHRRKIRGFPTRFHTILSAPAGHKKTPQVCVTYGVWDRKRVLTFHISTLCPAGIKFLTSHRVPCL